MRWLGVCCGKARRPQSSPIVRSPLPAAAAARQSEHCSVMSETSQPASTTPPATQAEVDQLSLLDRLPALLLAELGSHLSMNDLHRLSRASRRANALSADEDLWKGVFKHMHGLQPSDGLPAEISAAAEKAGSTRQLMLNTMPCRTAMAGGHGGGPFTLADHAYSPRLLALQAMHEVVHNTPCVLPRPVLPYVVGAFSPSTCRVVSAIRLWVSVPSPDAPHIRALQLQYLMHTASDASPRQVQWSNRAGGHDDSFYGLPPSPPTHTLRLEEGEHIVHAKCFAGPCRWARPVLLGIQFTTNRSRTFSCGTCDGLGGVVEKVSEFRFPHRMVNIWGRNGFVIDQIGFDYL